MLSTFRDLLEDYFAPFSGRVNASGGYCSFAAVYDIQKSVVDLSKQKAELSSQEERAERAALNTETETETEARLLFSIHIET